MLAKWRKKYKSKRYNLIVGKGEIIIRSLSTKKISDFFDSIEVSVKSPLTDWKN